MKLNISYPANGSQKLIEVDDERKLRAFMEKRMGTEVRIYSSHPINVTTFSIHSFNKNRVNLQDEVGVGELTRYWGFHRFLVTLSGMNSRAISSKLLVVMTSKV
jgi:hypothetical protein